MIKQFGTGWKATSESGRPLSKKVKSKSEALKQLYAVEMSKHRRARRMHKALKRLAD